MDAADYAYNVAATRELEQKQRDDAETKASTEHFYQAGGDPFRVDVNTGAPYMNDRERGILINQAKTMTQMYGNQLKDLRSQLNAAATDEDRARITAEYTDVKSKYDQFSNTLASMKPVDKTTALANSLISANTTDDKLDAAGALKQMDANQKKYYILYSPPELAAARKKIQDLATAQAQQEQNKKTQSAAAPNTPGNPAVLGVLQNEATKDAAIAHITSLQKAGRSESDIIADINNSKSFEPGDKAFLINQVKGLNDIRPGLTRVRNPKTGEAFNVSNGDTKQWTDKGFEIVGQGVQQPINLAPDQTAVVK